MSHPNEYPRPGPVAFLLLPDERGAAENTDLHQ